ncbi:hypothetical protein MTO96_052118 [Rhipicephalus appendiculatus]
MALAKSYFSGSRIINLIPCTSSEGRLCHIFREISVWNEHFWPLHLELRELSPGRLSLVERKRTYAEGYAYQDMREEMHVVASLLHHLLTNHHCVDSVAINTSILRDHHQLICDALCKSLSLGKLKLYPLDTAEQWARNIATALLRVEHLRELELRNIRLERTFIEAISEFLTSTRLLTTLTVTYHYSDHEDCAVAFLEGLGRNQTITTLSLDLTVFGAFAYSWRRNIAPPRSAVVFADYLCTNKTLRTLILKGGYRQRFAVVSRPIVEALIRNNTLTKLSLDSMSPEDEDIELVTRLLSRNRTLTSFEMIGCDTGYASSRANSYLAALKETTTLQELTLELPGVDATEGRSLFKALASKQSLKKVTLPYFDEFAVVEICRAIRDTGALERFLVEKQNVYENTVDVLTECKELSSVDVDSTHFRTEPFLTALSVLTSCSHVTSLRLALEPRDFRGKVSSLIVQCITGMTALRKLEQAIYITEMTDAFKKARRELAQALSVNKGIRKLILRGACFGETEVEMLADTLQSSRTLCELSFFPSEHGRVISLVRKLSTNISSNYTLLDMQVGRSGELGVELFTVADVIRRNCSLVTRAAHFVMGTRDRHCAAAAELMHSNPGLVEKVQQLASVGEDEAVSRIKKSLKSFSELDEFMRVAGVVKYGVTCQSRDDGKKQLVDIGRDCWLYLRQYVKVGDILNEQ